MPVRQADLYSSSVSPELIRALLRTLSPGRLETYMVAAGRNEERAVRLYLWNVTVGQSFHFPLQAVEVALRNCVGSSLAIEFGEEWYASAEFHALLDAERIADIEQVLKRIRNRRLPLNAGQVIAGLSFGFWPGMLHGRYNPRIWSRQLRVVFPDLPQGRARPSMEAKATRALNLRNRIFHHEPLIKRNLTADYGAIMDLLAWMCAHTHAWVRQHSSVPAVLRQKP